MSVVDMSTTAWFPRLVDDERADRMTAVDHRRLTLRFWTHMAPHGEVRLNMERRLSLRAEG